MAIKKLIIIKDTRESDRDIYTYSGPEWADKVLLIRKVLMCGDFSVIGGEGNIIIERKTVSDLCGSFTHDRERFEREWQRALDIPHKFLLIEGKMRKIIDGDYRSGIHPHSLLASIMSWSVRYKYNWFTVDNAGQGEECVFWLLKNYLKIAKE